MTAPSSGRAWAWAPVVILVGLIGAQLIVLGNVLHDPSFATEPDYYQKGVDWDTSQARKQQSNSLGWRSELHAESAGVPGLTLLRVQLSDGVGRPLAGARLRALAFHNARASRGFELRFEERAPGSYEAELRGARRGLWELRSSATRGTDRYERVFRVDLAPPHLDKPGADIGFVLPEPAQALR